MTGRPSNFLTWAVGNYPSGSDPWSSNPMRVSPISSYILPEATRPAETDNYLYGTLADQDSALLSYLGNLPAVNYPYGSAVTVTHGNVTTAAFYGNQLAVFSGKADGTTDFATGYLSLDGGKNFTSIGLVGVGVGLNSQVILANGLGGILAVLTNTGGSSAPYANGVFYYNGSWHSAVGLVGSAVATSVTIANGKMVWAGPIAGLVGTSNVALCYLTPSSPGTGLVPVGLPVSFPADLSNATAALITTNSSISVWAPSASSGSPATHAIRMPDVTTNGGWTFPSFPVTATTQTLLACAASHNTDAILFWRYDSSGGANELIRTYDGVTFSTLTAPVPTGSANVTLCCVGSLFICVFAGELFYSYDDGTTWSTSPITDLGAGTNIQQSIAGINQVAHIFPAKTLTSLIFN